MKKNTNSRKISLMKNLAWKKNLRRQHRVKERINDTDIMNDEEEINLLFPNLHGTDKEIKFNLVDAEKKIYQVIIPAALHENDTLEELKKYKDAPIPGFRKGFVNLTLIEFKYGKSIKEFLCQSKYPAAATQKIIETNSELAQLKTSSFNSVRGLDWSLNVMFYDESSDYNQTYREFMEKNVQPNPQEVEEPQSQPIE